MSGYLCQEHRHREGHEFDRQTITPSRLVYAAAVPPSCLSRGEESRGNLLRIQNFPFSLPIFCTDFAVSNLAFNQMQWTISYTKWKTSFVTIKLNLARYNNYSNGKMNP